MIYDVIIGRTLPTKYNYNYLKNIYTDRVSTKEEITDYKDLVGLITKSLEKAFEYVDELDDSVMTISTKFSSLFNDMMKSDLANDVIEHRIRELLSALAFSGYEMYIIKREDMKAANPPDSRTRAYMIDKHDGYFPELNRIATGTSLVFDDTRAADISTVIMEFIKDLKFYETVVEDIVGLDRFVEQYRALEDAHMGYAMNSDALVEFFDDYGYKFVVVVA